VAFLPPGCPGPYRIALGFYGKHQHPSKEPQDDHNG
jgi:hypothetical protein